MLVNNLKMQNVDIVFSIILNTARFIAANYVAPNLQQDTVDKKQKKKVMFSYLYNIWQNNLTESKVEVS